MLELKQTQPNQLCNLRLFLISSAVATAFLLSADGHGAAAPFSSGRGHDPCRLLVEIQNDTCLANRAFRRERLAASTYKNQLRLNPRQVYLLRTRSHAEAEKCFKAALGGLHQLRVASRGQAGLLRAQVLANYAWFIYPNNQPFFPSHLGLADRDRVARFLKQAVAADPKYAFAWICLCYLDEFRLIAERRGTPQYTAALGRYDLDTHQARKLSPRSPNALFLRAGFLEATNATPERVCHLYYLASKNLTQFSLRAVRYDSWAYDDICQLAVIYLRNHRACLEAAKALKRLPPLEPLPKGIVVHQFPASGKQ